MTNQIQNQIADTIIDQLLETEDYMMYHALKVGWSIKRYADIVVKIETDYREVWYTIAIANAPVEMAVYETSDFTDAVEAIAEAYEISQYQAVQF